MGQFRTPAFEHIREASLMMKVPMIILGALTVFIWFSLNPFSTSNIPLVSALSGGAEGVHYTTSVGAPALVSWRLLLLAVAGRSEEHTSELQSLMRISYAVFCLKTTR